MSWRLSAKLKAELEAAARDENASIDAMLSRIVRAWLETRARGTAGLCEEAGAYIPAANAAAGRARRARGRSIRRQRKVEDDAEQQRLREQLLKAVGTVSIGLGPYTNARVREVMGEALERKHRASQRHAPRRSR